MTNLELNLIKKTRYVLKEVRDYHTINNQIRADLSRLMGYDDKTISEIMPVINKYLVPIARKCEDINEELSHMVEDNLK